MVDKPQCWLVVGALTPLKQDERDPVIGSFDNTTAFDQEQSLATVHHAIEGSPAARSPSDRISAAIHPGSVQVEVRQRSGNGEREEVGRHPS